MCITVRMLLLLLLLCTQTEVGVKLTNKLTSTSTVLSYDTFLERIYQVIHAYLSCPSFSMSISVYLSVPRLFPASSLLFSPHSRFLTYQMREVYQNFVESGVSELDALLFNPHPQNEVEMMIGACRINDMDIGDLKEEDSGGV